MKVKHLLEKLILLDQELDLQVRNPAGDMDYCSVIYTEGTDIYLDTIGDDAQTIKGVTVITSIP